MYPFLGEIRAVSFGFAPKGWAQCNGQLLPINQNQPLFALLGVVFGGDGRQTFALPDLRGRTPVAQGPSTSGGSFVMGESSGSDSITLNVNHLPAHTHMLSASNSPASTDSPANGVWAVASDSSGSTMNFYTEAAPDVVMSPSALSAAGSGQPVSVVQPVTVLNYIIALTGMFPSRQ